jgi:hypothetical protein
MSAAERARAIEERAALDDYGRQVQDAAKALVQAVWQEKDPEARVEAWKVVQRVLRPATSYDFEVKP